MRAEFQSEGSRLQVTFAVEPCRSEAPVGSPMLVTRSGFESSFSTARLRRPGWLSLVPIRRSATRWRWDGGGWVITESGLVCPASGYATPISGASFTLFSQIQVVLFCRKAGGRLRAQLVHGGVCEAAENRRQHFARGEITDRSSVGEIHTAKAIRRRSTARELCATFPRCLPHPPTSNCST